MCISFLLYFCSNFFLSAATSFYLQQHFILQQLLFLQQPLFLQQLLILQTFYICCNIFAICSILKAIAASIFIMEQVLFVCRNYLKLQQLLNLQQKLLKIAARPLWAAVVLSFKGVA